jgi:hypothetical protein
MFIDSVVLSKDQQLELSRIAQSRSLPAGYVFRARLILMLAQGASFSTIKQRLGTTARRRSAGGSSASLLGGWMAWIRVIPDSRLPC